MASPVHCRTLCRCLVVVSSLPSPSVLLQVKYRCEFLEQTVYCVFSFPVGFTRDSRRTKSFWCRCSFDLLQLVLVNHHSTISSSSLSSSSSVTVPCSVRYPYQAAYYLFFGLLSWRLLLTCGTLWDTEYGSYDDVDNDRYHGQHQSIVTLVSLFLRSG
jgi:hypothetical protein